MQWLSVLLHPHHPLYMSAVSDRTSWSHRLIAEQKLKNAEAEKLEEQALQARVLAEAASERIQQ